MGLTAMTNGEKRKFMDVEARFLEHTQLTENIEFEFNVRIVNARFVGDLTAQRMIVVGRCELQVEKRRT